tara:strand:+ start:228 stop:767 length:540 start_codon:yes stop_codon:yes gene_type:complete
MGKLSQCRPIVGYEGLYEVSRSGETIRNIATGRVLAQSKSRDGYMKCALYIKGLRRYHAVHRLVSEAFHPNPDNKSTVNHINEVKDDNRAENLEWMTQQENSLHSSHKMRGSIKSSSVLTDVKVLEIKHHLEEGILKGTEIGSLYKVSKQVIYSIKSGKNWKWLKPVTGLTLINEGVSL